MNMTGHNSGMTPRTLQENLRSSLSQVTADGRTKFKGYRDGLVISAYILLAHDAACGGNEEVSDRELRAAGTFLPTDALAAERERVAARWIGRGGVLSEDRKLELSNEINELLMLGGGGPKFLSKISELAAVNPLSNRFRQHKRYVKIANLQGAYDGVCRECKKDIRDALDGKENCDLDKVRAVYSDVLFLSDTVEGWIVEEQMKRTEEYELLTLRRKAFAAKVEEAKAKKSWGDIDGFLSAEMKAERKLLDQKRKEAVAKRAAKEVGKLTHKQRRDREYARKSLAGGDTSMGQDYVEEASDE